MRISWVEEAAISCGAIPISLENLEALKEHHVRAIITLTEHPLTSHKVLNAEMLVALDFEVLHVPVVDYHSPTIEQAQQVFDFVERMKSEQKPVYLHCRAGVGRTGTMLHAIYLLSGMEFEHVKQKTNRRGLPVSSLCSRTLRRCFWRNWRRNHAHKRATTTYKYQKATT